MAVVDFSSLYLRMLSSLKKTYLDGLLDEDRSILEKDLLSQTSLENTEDTISVYADTVIFRDKWFRILAKAPGFALGLLLRTFFTKNISDTMVPALAIADAIKASGLVGFINGTGLGVKFSKSTIAEYGKVDGEKLVELVATNVDQVLPSNDDDVPVFDFLLKAINERHEALSVMVVQYKEANFNIGTLLEKHVMPFEKLWVSLDVLAESYGDTDPDEISKKKEELFEQAMKQIELESTWLATLKADWSAQVGKLEKDFKDEIIEFQDAFLTSKEIYDKFDEELGSDSFIAQARQMQVDAESGYALWEQQANYFFYSQYPSKRHSGTDFKEDNSNNGADDGFLDAFQHVFACAKWAIFTGKAEIFKEVAYLLDSGLKSITV